MGDVRLVVNGVEVEGCTSWSLDVQNDVVDVSDGVYRQYLPGKRSVTITLDGVRGFPGPPPRGDIVTHPGSICCCRHCPEGGKHG
jgi:hypothetical protein